MQHPYLSLTGPTRAVLAFFDPRVFEVVLKVKGAIECEDRDLSFFYIQFRNNKSYDTYYASKHSTLQLAFHTIKRSVEATISVRLVRGSSWPDGFHGVFTASIASIDDLEVLLLAFGDDNKSLALGDDGMIKLTRRVISVEHSNGELKVSVVAHCEQATKRDDIVFSQACR